VTEADSIDIEAVAMVGFVIAQFWTLLETWEVAETLNRSQCGRPRAVRPRKQDLLLARAQPLQVVEQVNVGHEV
jgi:hypothetical protein